MMRHKMVTFAYFGIKVFFRGKNKNLEPDETVVFGGTQKILFFQFPVSQHGIFPPKIWVSLPTSGFLSGKKCQKYQEKIGPKITKKEYSTVANFDRFKSVS